MHHDHSLSRRPRSLPDPRPESWRHLQVIRQLHEVFVWRDRLPIPEEEREPITAQVKTGEAGSRTLELSGAQEIGARRSEWA
jgi:hypothetical protein